MMEPDLEMNRETVEISNGRKLYNYRFTLEGEPLPPMSADDVVTPPVREEDKENP